MPSGYGQGAAEGLEDVLTRLFLEQRQKAMVAQQQAELAETARQADMRQRLGEGQLGLGRDRLGLDERELGQRGEEFKTTAGFKERELGMDEAMQPARLRLTAAQAGEIERKPQAEQQEREFITGRDRANYGYDLGKIGAQTAGERQLEGMRQMGRFQLAGAMPKAQTDADQYGAERSTRVLQSVDELENKVTPYTTGAGSLLSYFPGTEARNFQAELDTLKSNIAYKELTEMRQASKTGGALGQVSDRETRLLESSLGALDPMQSPANFKKQLQKVRESIQRWESAKSGNGMSNGPSNGPSSGGRGTNPAARAAELLKKYGG